MDCLFFHTKTLYSGQSEGLRLCTGKVHKGYLKFSQSENRVALNRGAVNEPSRVWSEVQGTLQFWANTEHQIA